MTTQTTGPVVAVPTVSAVITTHNRPKQVIQAIDAALALDQSRFRLELIVVDDGSTDETPDVLAPYTTLEHPIRLIRTDGLGMAGARNVGLTAASGDFFCLLDDDDVWLPNAISTQLDEFERHPEYAAVHAQAQMTDHQLEPFAEPFPVGPLHSGMIFERVLRYFPQVGTILTRMDAAREAGLFDPSLTGDNDWDWLLRIAGRHPIGAVETPVVLFRQRPEAFEEIEWKRFPDVRQIFARHTRTLPLRRRVRLWPILWRHQGWYAGVFVIHAERNWRNGERRRAARSLGYAARISPIHTLAELARRVYRRVS
jgi:glycosyltransferase involved in cell wall biosynthesis